MAQITERQRISRIPAVQLSEKTVRTSHSTIPLSSLYRRKSRVIRVPHNQTRRENLPASVQQIQLIPEECIFLDDRLANLDAASKLDFNTLLVTDPIAVRTKLESILDKENI